MKSRNIKKVLSLLVFCCGLVPTVALASPGHHKLPYGYRAHPRIQVIYGPPVQIFPSIEAYRDKYYDVRNYKDYALEVLEHVNKERRSRGLAPLTLSTKLCAAADIRAKELLVSVSHTRPDGSPYHTVLGSPKVYMAENAAAGQSSAERVVQSWMESQGHRDNILNPNMKILGVGYYYDDSSEYLYHWIQIFMG